MVLHGLPYLFTHVLYLIQSCLLQLIYSVLENFLGNPSQKIFFHKLIGLRGEGGAVWALLFPGKEWDLFAARSGAGGRGKTGLGLSFLCGIILIILILNNNEVCICF